MNLFLRLCLAALLLWVSLGLPGAAQPSGEGFDQANLDTRADPAVDFYQYANGGWMKSHPVPEDRARWGTFNILADRNQDVLHQILEQCAADRSAAPGSIEQKLGDFYASGMDTVAVNQAGLDPLTGWLGRIEQVQSPGDLQQVATELHARNIDVYFNFYSEQDYKDSRQVIGAATQGGLGLPDRDYYFREDEASQKIRSEYRAHVQRVFQLAGDSAQTAKTRADQVFEFESRLAEAAYDRVKMREPSATYHVMDRAGLARLTPHWDWPAYFEAVGHPEIASINVETPEFLTRVNELLGTVPLEQHKTYLRWHLLRKLSPYLSEAFEQEDFRFTGQTLSGAKTQLPRWRRVVGACDRCLGEALGQKYVEKTFSPTAKARVREMVENIRTVLRQDLEQLPWMEPATRQAALAKLAAFRYKIGYPDTWIDYSTVSIDRGIYVDNVLRCFAFARRRDLDKIGKPVDPDEWYMTPPTVNAYYDPSNNEIVFPAGILQPPFFSENAPEALNYGGIGMVIGHEVTHGFDDQGSKFDGQGNLRNWWTPEDLKRFEKLSQGVVDEYSGYSVGDGLKINGKLVVGEAIADMGGLKLAYLAMQRALEGKPRVEVDGFTPEQLFFLGYARVWAMNMRPEYVRLQVNTDPHPHPRWRVNGPISHMPEFCKAFHCKPGDPMVKDEKERNPIW